MAEPLTLEEREAIAAKIVAGYEWTGGTAEAVDDLALMLSTTEAAEARADAERERAEALRAGIQYVVDDWETDEPISESAVNAHLLAVLAADDQRRTAPAGEGTGA